MYGIIAFHHARFLFVTKTKQHSKPKQKSRAALPTTFFHGASCQLFFVVVVVMVVEPPKYINVSQNGTSLCKLI